MQGDAFLTSCFRAGKLQHGSLNGGMDKGVCKGRGGHVSMRFSYLH